MLSKKQKVKCVSRGILRLFLWLVSMLWARGMFYVILTKPEILTFTLLVLDLFCMWQGISGLTRNIMRLQLNKTISELEKMKNDDRKDK